MDLLSKVFPRPREQADVLQDIGRERLTKLYSGMLDIPNARGEFLAAVQYELALKRGRLY